MLVSFCVWCKVIGPGIGGLIVDRPDLVRFQGCINHFWVFYVLKTMQGDSSAFV